MIKFPRKTEQFSKTFRTFAPKDIQMYMEDNMTTMAAEPAVAYRATSYMDAMAVIHTMHLTREDKERVGRRLVVETTEANLSKAFDTLEHLSKLQFGWDGYSALPISRKVINNLRSVLLISDNDDWRNWMISPDGNATIMLQSGTRRASISLGAEEFSYYLKTDDIRKGESHVDFSAPKFLSIMRELNDCSARKVSYRYFCARGRVG